MRAAVPHTPHPLSAFPRPTSTSSNLASTALHLRLGRLTNTLLRRQLVALAFRVGWWFRRNRVVKDRVCTQAASERSSDLFLALRLEGTLGDRVGAVRRLVLVHAIFIFFLCFQFDVCWWPPLLIASGTTISIKASSDVGTVWRSNRFMNCCGRWRRRRWRQGGLLKSRSCNHRVCRGRRGGRNGRSDGW